MQFFAALLNGEQETGKATADTGVLRCAQDEGVGLAMATARAAARAR